MRMEAFCDGKVICVVSERGRNAPPSPSRTVLATFMLKSPASSTGLRQVSVTVRMIGSDARWSSGVSERWVTQTT